MRFHSAFMTITLGAMAALPVHAQQKADDMKGMKMDPAKSASKESKPVKHQATGTEKAVDPAKGSVTLAHGPVKSLNWPGMTMGFEVEDKALLAKIKPGDKVQFEFAQKGKNYVIEQIKK